MVNAAYPVVGDTNPTMLGALPFYHIYGKSSLQHESCPFLTSMLQVQSSCYISRSRAACQL